ncbi:MAG TPA: DUF4097 family beta strand repeat-containing protein [Terriglobales bacterium]|nr:DUF4097 family beta strand repeat-containing protein [Terriglobales bacterium]
MGIRSCRSYLLAAFAVAMMAGAGWAQGQSESQGNEFHWNGKIPAEGVIIIKNVNGDIDAEPATGDQAEVTAEKSGPRAKDVTIEVDQLPDGVMICAVYPGWFQQHCQDWHSSNIGSDKTKVHFRVKVPENVRLHAQSVNGDVKAEHLGRFVRANTVNGSVRVSTKSWVEAATVNGSIEAKMGSADWTGALKEDSVNGSITLELPSDTNAEVSFASVNGTLQSDFPFVSSGKLTSHMIKGQIGNGGRDLKVNTVNGSVTLKKRESI